MTKEKASEDKKNLLIILTKLKLKPKSFYEFVTGNEPKKDEGDPQWSYYPKDEVNFEAYNRVCLEQNHKIDKLIVKILEL